MIVGAPKGNRLLGPLGRMARLLLAAKVGNRSVVAFMAKLERDDLETLAGLLESGAIASLVDRSYSLAEVPEALAYLGEGHARGKVVITVPGGPQG